MSLESQLRNCDILSCLLYPVTFLPRWRIVTSKLDCSTVVVLSKVNVSHCGLAEKVFEASPNGSVVSCLLFLSKSFSSVCINSRVLKRSRTSKQINCSVCVWNILFEAKAKPQRFQGNTGMALFFFSHVLDCAAPPPGTDLFPNRILEYKRVCRHRGTWRLQPPPVLRRGVSSMLLRGLQRRRPAWDQVQEEAKESCDVLLLITWSPRLPACRCALDYREHQQHPVVAFFRFNGLKELRRQCSVPLSSWWQSDREQSQ